MSNYCKDFSNCFIYIKYSNKESGAMRFAIYSRKSKFTGKGESVENQIEMCKDYIFSKFHDIKNEDILIYEDEGFSAKNLERPAFKKMMNACKSNPFDFIVCYRLDRISRSVSDFSTLIEKLNKQGVSFICIKEQFDTSTPMGRAMMYIASVFAQLERETLAERVRDNMFMLARSGRWLGGTPPTGYSAQRVEEILFENKIKTSCSLVENPQEVNVVKLIFKVFLETYSLSAVSKFLIARGTLSRTGNYFSVLGIKDILSNPVYCFAEIEAYNYYQNLGADLCFEKNECTQHFGLIAYNKRSGTTLGNVRNDKSKWIIAIGRHKGIINAKDFVRIQNRLCKNRQNHNFVITPHNDYSLLSGVIVCKKCNNRMFSKKRTGSDSFDYICSNKLRGGLKLCDNQNIKGEVIDKTILEIVSKRVNCGKTITNQLSALKSELIKQPIEKNTEIEKKVLQCNEKISNLIEVLATSTVSNEFTNLIEKKIEDIKNQKITLIKLIDNAKIGNDIRDNDTFKKLSDENVLSIMTIGEKREIIKSNVKKILWDGQTMTVFLFAQS